jgi:hypothetical protein
MASSVEASALIAGNRYTGKSDARQKSRVVCRKILGILDIIVDGE